MRVCVWPITMLFSVLFLPLTDTHTNTYILYAHTAAVLHYAITPTPWSVKERKPRSNSRRTPTAPSVLTQQPPPVWAQVCLPVWRMGGRRHFILHMHILTDTQPLTQTHIHTHTYTQRCCHQGTQAPPMYKPHTPAPESGRAGKTSRCEDGDRRREQGRAMEGEKRARDVLTLEFVFIKWVWLKGFRGAPGHDSGWGQQSRAEGVWDTRKVS